MLGATIGKERVQGPGPSISVMLSHSGADSISTLDVASDVVLLKLRLYFVLRILNRLNRYERRQQDVPNVAWSGGAINVSE